MYKVSIITVCRNAESSIRRTIESVIALSREDVEYVVIDGASSDRTPAILAEYASSLDGRMKWISEKDDGIYDAMNKGLRLATGEWVNYQNEGDEILNIPFSELEVSKRRGDAILACAVNTEQGVQRPSVNFITRCRNTIPHQGAFYRRSIISAIGGYDASYRILGDHDLNVRVLRSDSGIALSDVVCSFHSVNGISSHGGDRIKSEMRRVVRENYGVLMMCVAAVENKIFGLRQWLDSHLPKMSILKTSRRIA